MTKLTLKQILVISAILGGLLGVGLVVWLVKIFAFFALIFLVAPAVLIYLKRFELIGFLTPTSGAVLGSFAGFIATITCSIVFVPLTLILYLFFNKLIKLHYYDYGLSFLIGNGGFGVLILLVLSIAFILALTNAFSGLLTAYIYEQLEQNIISEHNNDNNFNIEEITEGDKE